jgi:DNA replication and repair protein RecF
MADGCGDPHIAVVDKPLARIAVVRLTVAQFRSYARADLRLDRRPVVLAGPNGAGKTNLLEALSFLSPGRGLRNATLDQVTRHQAQGDERRWGVAARIEMPEGAVDVGTGLDPDGGERRVVRIDGVPVAGSGALARVLRLTWLTPSMDRIFVEGATERRRFLDRLVFNFEPDHALNASDYAKAMRERNRLLRVGRFDPAWLGALEARMAEAGVALAAARAETVERLNGMLTAAWGAFPRAVLALDGTLDAHLAAWPAVEAEEWLKAALAASRQRDAEVGRALEGPHRTDLRVYHAGKDGMAAELCSTCEQKALLIAIVLAGARLQAAEHPGGAPVLLLDEVTAHLDAERRIALFEELGDLGCQAWLTGTDEALFAPFGARAQHFRLGPDGIVAVAGGRGE